MDLHREFHNSRLFHEERIERRDADMLIGLAAGITADGTVNQQEALFLRDWIKQHLIDLDDPVINLLYRRLHGMLIDNCLDPEESRELLQLLQQFTGIQAQTVKPFTAGTTLPLCDPTPDLTWDGALYLFTGTMAFVPRRVCEQEVTARGGRIAPSVSKKLNFLVIGTIGNEQWLHSSYGLKIKRAVELRDQGAPLHIISEEHWQQSVFR